MKATFLPFLLLLSIQVEARVFDFKNEKVASFLGGTAGLSNLKKMGYEFAGPTGLTFNDEAKYLYTGELGVLISMKSVNWRLGLELLRPHTPTDVAVKNAAQTTLYSLTSGVLGAGAVTYLDFILGGGPSNRFYLTIGAGYTKVTLKNEYIFTADGTTAYGLGPYTEEGSSWAYSAMAGAGWESVLADTVTFTFNLGYRYMLAQKFIHEREAQTLLGAVAPGQVMKNNDGTDRKLDLSSTWVGLGLRFYLRFL